MKKIFGILIIGSILFSTAAYAQSVIQTGYTAIAGTTVVIPVTFGQKRCLAGAQKDVLCQRNTDCPDSLCALLPFTPTSLSYRVDIGSTSLVATTNDTPVSATYVIRVPSNVVGVPSGMRSPVIATAMVKWSDPSGNISMQDINFSIRTPRNAP